MLQPVSEDLGEPFDNGVLQSNWPKVLSSTSIIFFREDKI